MDKDEEEEHEGDILSLQDQRDALAGIHTPLTKLSLQDDQFVGFNGRCNKRADTCYAFWVGASLSVSPKLNKQDRIDLE